MSWRYMTFDGSCLLSGLADNTMRACCAGKHEPVPDVVEWGDRKREHGEG